MGLAKLEKNLWNFSFQLIEIMLVNVISEEVIILKYLTLNHWRHIFYHQWYVHHMLEAHAWSVSRQAILKNIYIFWKIHFTLNQLRSVFWNEIISVSVFRSQPSLKCLPGQHDCLRPADSLGGHSGSDEVRRQAARDWVTLSWSCTRPWSSRPDAGHSIIWTDQTKEFVSLVTWPDSAHKCRSSVLMIFLVQVLNL